MPSFNNRIRQVLILGILLLLIYVIIKELFAFLPGILGAVTFYILSRRQYFIFIYKKNMKKSRAAWLFIIFYLVLIGIPFYLAITLISPKINAVLANPTEVMQKIQENIAVIQEKVGVNLVSQESLSKSLNAVIDFLPGMLNSTAMLVTNLAIMLFLLYFMLINGRELEKYLNRITPLKQQNINKLSAETKRVVKANALGIPLISIIQGVVATIGYLIFGVSDWGLWGFLTGVFAFFPVVGTAIVWIPLVLFTFATGETWQGVGLLLYSVVVTGNVDYVARVSLLKRMGDVHPVITILGVLVGLNLFGFIGLVFGPLLISYLLVLFEIYMNEFVDPELSVDLNDNKPVTESSGEDS
jgi:predicted PurR-regulated permease PerM